MPKVKVVDMAGKEVGALTLSDKVFGAEVNGAGPPHRCKSLPSKSETGHAVHAYPYGG